MARESKTSISDFRAYTTAVERLAAIREQLSLAKQRFARVEHSLSIPQKGELQDIALAIATGEASLDAMPDLHAEYQQLQSRIHVLRIATEKAEQTLQVEANKAVNALIPTLLPRRRELMQRQIDAARMLADALEAEADFRNQVQANLSCWPFTGDALNLPRYGLRESVSHLRDRAAAMEKILAEPQPEAPPQAPPAKRRASEKAATVDADSGLFLGEMG